MKKIKELNSSIKGVPNYFEIYLKWADHYKSTGNKYSKKMANHYAKIAEEMGQAVIECEES